MRKIKISSDMRIPYMSDYTNYFVKITPDTPRGIKQLEDLCDKAAIIGSISSTFYDFLLSLFNGFPSPQKVEGLDLSVSTEIEDYTFIEYPLQAKKAVRTYGNENKRRHSIININSAFSSQIKKYFGVDLDGSTNDYYCYLLGDAGGVVNTAYAAVWLQLYDGLDPNDPYFEDEIEDFCDEHSGEDDTAFLYVLICDGSGKILVNRWIDFFEQELNGIDSTFYNNVCDAINNGMTLYLI